MELRRATKGFIAAMFVAAVLPGCGGKNDESATLPEIQLNVNLVTNPSFEEWDGFMPVGWQMRVFSGEGKTMNMYGKNAEHSFSGEHSYFLRGLSYTDKWMVLSQTHPVRPGYEVHFSGHIKTDNIQRGKGQDDNANLFLIFRDKDGRRVNDRYYADAWTNRRLGTGNWAFDEEKADVPDGAVSMEIGLINRMTGYAYFDDISLVIRQKLEWQEKETKFITFRWQPQRPFPGEDMDREVRLVEAVAGEVGIRKTEKRIYYRLYPDEQTFFDVTGRKRYQPFTRWADRELHSLATYEDHEMIHLILYDLGTPPFGLAKGLVFYFRAKYNGWDLHNAAKQDLFRKDIPALFRTINQRDFADSKVSVTVPAWGSFVTWLIDRHGMDKLLELYRTTNEITEAGPFSARFKSVYGVDFQKMDQDWRWFLLRYECDAAADTIF